MSEQRTEPEQQHLFIFDTTLRDGQQPPGFPMHLEEKLPLAQQLEKLGAEIVEAAKGGGR